ncbi:MAG: DNA-directed RNA polymerase subunit N [Methanomethylovorans sp.]|uniref:DNA-directed RNA polymerase subunit N n=1 Tax=Methanomethylovorans sp. TaxID=2758717 RepID=UPI000A99BE1A|nr:DNA-directed RNA polymerase subunit N [Methanomethylovorans sp.]
MIPVRCFSCGKVIASSWDEYKRRTKDGEEPAQVMDDLGITRYCCRRMLLSHVELIDTLAPYQ